ncbi:MAG: MATE family efflux transporter [Rhodospirillales bacterium]|nr:MATE family efflux transporter [Rhodospirillales bacterium]HJO72532.1 MATE family efflux transporter [Rhodospirillales bacterium]
MDAQRLRTILNLALPIVGGMVSQNILSLVDTAMVGTLGPEALAAVGVAGFASFMAAATIMGLASGVQAMTARRLGEGREDECAVPLNGGLLLALIIGAPLALVLFALAPDLFPYLNGDPGVIADGVPYFQARVLAIVGVGMNFAFRGYWTGVSLTRLYLITLVVMHLCNVVLNYVLIFGKLGFPALGTTGAGIGTALATYIGTAIYLALALRRARRHGFLERVPRRLTMNSLLRLSIPSAVQQFLFASGMTVFFWIIGQVGTAETAVSNVIVNLLLVVLLPGMGLGLAAMTLVSLALGRGEADEARRWGFDVVKLACVILGMLGLPGIFMPEVLLAGFIHEPDTLRLGVAPLRLMGAMMIVEAVGLVLMNALLGAGAAHQVMVVSVASQWLIGLPAAWLVGAHWGLGLFAVWLCFEGYRAVNALALLAVWLRGRWTGIRI